MTSALAIRPHECMRLRGRSLMAFVLAPALPVSRWVAQLDTWSKNSPNFFASRPIILDLAGVSLGVPEIAELIGMLAERGIRVMGLEGVEPDQLGPSLPPLLQGGRSTAGREAIPTRTEAAADMPAAGTPQPPAPGSLLIDTPIRSGQSILFPSGDVTVIGSVSSGAEIVAGGSIHVMARCADVQWQARPATRAQESSAAGTKPSSSPSTAITAPQSKWTQTFAASPPSAGCKTASSRSQSWIRPGGEKQHGQGSRSHVR